MARPQSRIRPRFPTMHEAKLGTPVQGFFASRSETLCANPNPWTPNRPDLSNPTDAASLPVDNNSTPHFSAGLAAPQRMALDLLGPNQADAIPPLIFIYLVSKNNIITWDHRFKALHRRRLVHQGPKQSR